MAKCDFIGAVTAQPSQFGEMCFKLPDDVLTTRDDGEAMRTVLEKRFDAESPKRLEIAFGAVKALTISYVDAFLGRFLTELALARRKPDFLLLSELTEDTAPEVDAVLSRRKLLAVAVVDREPTLLGADDYFRATFQEASALGTFSPNDLAAAMGITVQNANNRLKRLVAMSALSRRRSDPEAGGREYTYAVLPAIEQVKRDDSEHDPFAMVGK